MLPAVVRKIVFNKLVLAGQIVSERLVSLADFEHWSAPLSAWAITGMSGLPPKGPFASNVLLGSAVAFCTEYTNTAERYGKDGNGG